MLTGRPAVCTHAILMWRSCFKKPPISIHFWFSPVWFYTRVSPWEVDVFLVFAAKETTKDLMHCSSRVSVVLIRRMFTLRIRGSTKMESTTMNPIIIFTPRQGKPHCRHTHWLLHCESTWSSVINVRGAGACCSLCRHLFMVRKSRRSKRNVMIKETLTVLDMQISCLGKHLMKELVVCRQAEAHTSSSLHRHL